MIFYIIIRRAHRTVQTLTRHEREVRIDECVDAERASQRIALDRRRNEVGACFDCARVERDELGRGERARLRRRGPRARCRGNVAVAPTHAAQRNDVILQTGSVYKLILFFFHLHFTFRNIKYKK